MAKKKGRGRPSPQLHVPSWPRAKCDDMRATYSQPHPPSQPHTAVMGVMMDNYVRQKSGSSQSQPQIPSQQSFAHSVGMGATRQQASSMQSHSRIPSRPSSHNVSMGAARQQSSYIQSHSRIPYRPSSYSTSMGATMDAFLRELPSSSHSQPRIHGHTDTLESEDEPSSENEDESSAESEDESSSAGNENDQNCEGG